MASQVLSGTNTTLSYANNTGQNVRVVINFLRSSRTTITAGNMTISLESALIGKTSAISSVTTTLFPNEVMLSPGQVFSATGVCTFNIVVIPEAG